MRKLILASASPRRKEILEQVGIPFEVAVSHVDEVIPDAPPYDIVQELARQKAQAVAEMVWKDNPNAVILGADTVVVLDGIILGKPKDRADAERMIRSLSGRSHEVYTGVAVYSKERMNTFFERTVVSLRAMEEDEIQSYLNTDEPYDKAGAYAVQGRFACFVEKLNGDFYNVMGLPISRVYSEFRKSDLFSY